MLNKRLMLQDQSCRVALAAFLHDLGKLAQRASAFDRDPRRDAHLTLYCPFRKEGGYHSHLHAADTGLALDALERHLPELLGGDPSPFQPRGSADVTDSLINAAAAHHKPDTLLQWIIATADRVASGFERTEFETYNSSKERDDFRSARMLVRFEEYGGPGANPRCQQEADFAWRYPLTALSPDALMPVPKDAARGNATGDYAALWQMLLGDGGQPAGVGRIPKSHRGQWPLWLDHFDTLWQTLAHAIPSATAFGTRPDVSLYDHSKTTAALAVALWRHSVEHGEVSAKTLADRSDWDMPKFLLVQGDFSGIQNFIFGGDGVTQKKAAKLLRGRSAMVSLFTELAALAVLDELSLPPTSQVMNTAGRFLIVAPDTADARAAVEAVQKRLDAWFLDQMFGMGGIALATTSASCADFVGKDHFAAVNARLWKGLEAAKRQMFGLAAAERLDPVLEADFSGGSCVYDGRLPASMPGEDGNAHPLSVAAIQLGKALADPGKGRLLVFAADGAPDGTGMLPIELFGYRVMLTGDKEASGNFGAFALEGQLRRAFDISLPPADGQYVAWNGYARRALSAFVPLHGHQPEADKRFDGLDPAERGDLKTFEYLACSDQTIDERDRDRVLGVEALGILKGDIDDLGALFASIGDRPSFAKWAETSRRISAFFTIWLPSMMAREPDFRNIYTVFAGGDDFLFIGPWRTVRRFAARLRQEFTNYVAGNPALHFSAGYVMAKPGHPVRLLAADADEELENAKARVPAGRKNAFALHGTVIGWDAWDLCVEDPIRSLERHMETDKLSTGFVYGLLQLSEMAADHSKPENARWRSRLHYQTRRHFEALKIEKSEREPRSLALITSVGEQGIASNPGGVRIALFDQLYARRK